MDSVTKRQEMPPDGGYKTIPFKRVPARQFFSGYALIGGYLGMTAGAAYIYYLNCLQVQKEEIELRSGRIAIEPLLKAERDREYLKQLRRNRDEEAKLMANVEGWKVGTLYGEPIFKTRPDAFIEPKFHEYYMHTDLWSQKLRQYFVWLS
ncbi:hypothetical protein WA026_010105 [Henosepilachna vigintioctopunctata]|uniref:NADH dehydrogenase [ubiquinone] 1 alpha subcomplex subunit 13 n=1 Tax=Henosepilachna vigintioctopunctata TaxID=420089 RepID=A0AAW1UKF8_9CUCU